MGVAVSSSHVVSAAPSSSGGGLLTLCPCSSVRSLSWETVLHKLLQRESFPRAATLHELPQHGSFPRSAVLQEQAAPAWVLHGVTSPARKPAPAWAPLSTGPQVLAGTCSSTGLPTGSQPPSDSHLLQCGVYSMGYRWRSDPLWTSMGCRWTACLTMVFSTSCKGRLSAPASQACPPAPSSLTLVSAELFLSHLLTPLSRLPFYHSFFPLLKYVIAEVLPPLLIGLALASGGSVLALAGTGFIRDGGSFSQKPPLYPPHYPNLATQTHNRPLRPMLSEMMLTPVLLHANTKREIALAAGLSGSKKQKRIKTGQF